jgi:hypothetical protein
MHQRSTVPIGKTPTVRDQPFEEILADLAWGFKMQEVHLPDVRSEGGGEQKPILQWPPCCISPNSVRQNALGFFASFDDWMRCYKGPLDALERAEDAKGYELAVQAFQEVMQSPVMRAEHDAYRRSSCWACPATRSCSRLFPGRTASTRCSRDSGSPGEVSDSPCSVLTQRDNALTSGFGKTSVRPSRVGYCY